MIKIYDDPENRLFRKIIVEYDFNSDSTKISAELYSLILFMKNSKDYSLEDINALVDAAYKDNRISLIAASNDEYNQEGDKQSGKVSVTIPLL